MNAFDPIDVNVVGNDIVANAVYTELSVPDDAKDIDILSFFYKIKDGKIKVQEKGMDFPLVVEEGCVFAMGDNRNASKDSRHPAIGQIDKREIMGKALFLFYPGAHEDTNVRDFDRIGALN